MHKLKEWGKPLYSMVSSSPTYSLGYMFGGLLGYVPPTFPRESLWSLFGSLLRRSLCVSLGFTIQKSTKI